MKLSAILVSVNLVAATMPLAAQAENAVSDKADWLKRSIAEMETTKKAPPRKISMSDAGVTPQAKTPKLRPFVPNRRLPSERDLSLSAMSPRMDTAPSLTAQQPVMGQTDQPLSAQISAYSFESPSAAASRRVASQMQPAPTAVPGRVPSLPGQVAARNTSAPSIPVIPEPPSATPPAYMNLQAPAAKISRILPASVQPERLLKQAGALLVQAPVLTPDERSLVNELVQLNKPGNSQDFIDVQGGKPVAVPMPQASSGMDSQPAAPAAERPDIGPPPFPLNLLPADQLKDFVGRRHQQKIAAPPAYFGSWHRPTAVVQHVLPYAGFQTHLQSRRVLASNYSQYAPVVSIRSGSQHRRAKKHYESHPTVVSHTNVLVYPSYNNVNRVSMF